MVRGKMGDTTLKQRYLARLHLYEGGRREEGGQVPGGGGGGGGEGVDRQ